MIQAIKLVGRDCCGTFRQQGGSQLKPMVLEGTLQSPKLLAAAHGSNAKETNAAVSALGSAIQKLQQQLGSVYNDRFCIVSLICLTVTSKLLGLQMS